MGSFHVVGDAQWRPAKTVHVVGDGAWRAAKEVWVYASGVWRKAWSARTVSIYVSGYQQVGGFGSAYSDRITFSVETSDGAVPSSYLWSGGGGSIYSTTASAIFDGPPYNINGFTYQASGQVFVSVIVDGQSYDAFLDFTYTAGDEI